jgi:hypothetical protein
LLRSGAPAIWVGSVGHQAPPAVNQIADEGVRSMENQVG